MQLSFVEGRNRMKLCNKISKGVAKGAEVICMLTIAALVLVIVVELLRRNFLGQSFGGNVQLCGILFLWMAFIGLIPLYRDSGLMRLDFLVARTKGPVYEVLLFPQAAREKAMAPASTREASFFITGSSLSLCPKLHTTVLPFVRRTIV